MANNKRLIMNDRSLTPDHQEEAEDYVFVKVIPIATGPTIQVKHYKTYRNRIGVRFDESTRALYELLCLAKTLPELLREALFGKLKAEKKDLKWLSRTQNQSAYTLEALLTSLPKHIENLRTQANLLEDWLEEFDKRKLAAKLRKVETQAQIAKNLAQTENSA